MYGTKVSKAVELYSGEIKSTLYTTNMPSDAKYVEVAIATGGGGTSRVFLPAQKILYDGCENLILNSIYPANMSAYSWQVGMHIYSNQCGLISFNKGSGVSGGTITIKAYV